MKMSGWEPEETFPLPTMCRFCEIENDAEFTDHNACYACRAAELTGIINTSLILFTASALESQDPMSQDRGVNKLNEAVANLERINDYE